MFGLINYFKIEYFIYLKKLLHMSSLRDNKNISLQNLIDFLENYVNTDEDSVEIKFAKELVNDNKSNYNMVINSYYDFYKNYKKYF